MLAEALVWGVLHCSGLLGRTPLRQLAVGVGIVVAGVLFRSSRPDSIETDGMHARWIRAARRLFRSSRPDSIETAATDAVYPSPM